MNFEVEKVNEDSAIVMIDGAIDKDSIVEFKEKSFGILNKKRYKIIYDFKDVECVDDSLLSVLVDLEKKVEANGGRIIFCNLTEVVSKYFKVLHLEKLVIIKDSVEDGLKELKKYF